MPEIPEILGPLQTPLLQIAFQWWRVVIQLLLGRAGKLIFLGTLSSMNDKELDKELKRRHKMRQLENLEANNTRAQSITVGTAGGGTTEITMRSASGSFLWNTYQPVEIIELIHQLSANVGCHLQLVS